MEVGDLNLEGWLSFTEPRIALRELGYWDDQHPYALYRLYDGAGGLLYVGITAKSVRTRLATHRRRPWWKGVVRVEVVYGYTRVDAQACELAAIQGEQPLHNISGVDYGWPRKGGLAGWAYQ